MLKIVVFDSGWGGELIADYIEEELAVVEVIRVIDWQNAPYANKNQQEILRKVEASLLSYIGRADLIVLGGFVFRFLIDVLAKRYPEQKFVTVDLKPMSISLRATHRVMILADQKLKDTDFYYKIRQSLAMFDVVEPMCNHWTEMIDEGTMTKTILRKELQPFIDKRIDTVLILNTHFWDIEEDLEDVLGYQVRIIDQREALKKNICMALEFEGAKYAA